MLIYFSDEAFASLIGLFARSLLPGGYLLLGHSESLLDRKTAVRAGDGRRRRGLPEAGGRVIRVFLVDDSAFVRRALTRVLAVEPGFQVVGEAASGSEALARITAADPDLVTLDVVMPGMDGLQLLPALLRWKPSLKVLMLSAHTREGADATVAALAAGAVDFIDKTTFNVMDLEYLRREVVDRMKAVAPGRRVERRPHGAPAPAAPDAPDLRALRALRDRRLDRRPGGGAAHPAGAARARSRCRWSWCSTCRSGSPGRSPSGSPR